MQKALSRVAAVVIIVILLVVVAAGAYLATRQTNTEISTSLQSSSSSTATSSSVSTIQTSSLETSSASSTLSSISSSSSSSSSQVLTTSSSSTNSSQTGTTSSGNGSVQTLVIDDAYWPIDDLNQLWAFSGLPWPDWQLETVYQSLVAINEPQLYGTAQVQLQPGLSTNWTTSADAMTYTFNLRQGVTFSNGDPFNAYQVWMEMYGFYYLSANSSTWLQSFDLFDMSKANFGPATVALINQSGLITPSQQALNIMENSSWPVYVTGPNQIVFHLKGPFLYLPGTLVGFEGLVFDTQYVLDHGGFGTPTAVNNYFNQHSIPGTGPYEVSGIAENQFVKYTQNPTYWGKNLTASQIAAQPIFDPGHAKNVVINYKPDDVTRYVDLSTGQAQISAILYQNWNLIINQPNKFSYFNPPIGEAIEAMILQTHKYPTNITDVRQAIVHAINYTHLGNTGFFGKVTPFVGPEIPVWKDFYDLGNFTPYSYNVTLAKQYLAQANITNMPTLSFRVLSGCLFCASMAEEVQTDLEAIGIPVQINVYDLNTYFAPFGSYTTNVHNAANLSNMEFEGASGIEPPTATPVSYWPVVVSNGSSFGNEAAYYSPNVQPCVNALVSSSNTSYVQSLCKTAQKQIYNDAPYAWLGINNLFYVAGSLAWQKGIVTGMFADPLWQDMDTTALFNTVTFA